MAPTPRFSPARIKISKSGLEFIKSFESFVPYVYDDLVPPVNGKYREWKGERVHGTLTIGYGHTNDAKHPLKIKHGLRVTEAEACEILDVDLDDCEAAVRAAVKKPITQGMYDALTSFAFNCGAGNMRNIARRINDGNEDEARASFDYYVKSKGKVMRGLQRRRDGEQALWDSATPANIEIADTFHSAEVDNPEAPLPPPVTKKDLVGVSRKITLLATIKRLFAWTGLGTGGAYSFTELTGQGKDIAHAVAEFAQDNALMVLGVGLVVGFILASIIEDWIVEDANDGRYSPWGAVEGDA